MTILKTTDSGTTDSAILSADDLARLPNDGTLHELVEGVLVEMSRPKCRHGRVQGKLAAVVGHYVYTQQLGDVLAESGFILTHDPDTVRGPDFAFVAAGRTLQYDEQEQYYDGAPDLAVEIVSPNDNAVDLRELIDLYFAADARLV